MGDVIGAVNQGSIGSLTLALAGALITALIAIVLWLTRDRLKARERFDEKLEQRLGAGSEKMAQLERDLRELHVRTVEMSSRMVNHDQCEEHKREIRAAMERAAENSAELKSSILRLDGRADEGFRQVSRLLSGLVKIPRGEPEENKE